MTDDLLPETPMTAAELALGLLEGDERAAALRRTLTDPLFAAEVESWRDHFGLLFDAVPEIAAPGGGLARVEASIDAKGNRMPGPAMRAANDDGPVRFWRALAVASSIAATFLMAITLFAPARVAPGTNGPQIAQTGLPSLPGALLPGTLLVAQLQPVKGSGPVAVVFDPARILRERVDFCPVGGERFRERHERAFGAAERAFARGQPVKGKPGVGKHDAHGRYFFNASRISRSSSTSSGVATAGADSSFRFKLFIALTMRNRTHATMVNLITAFRNLP